MPALACEAVLCLSSSLQPGECAASLNHYFDIRKYAKGMLDWEATVDARRFFLGMCPVAAEPGMSVLVWMPFPVAQVSAIQTISMLRMGKTSTATESWAGII